MFVTGRRRGKERRQDVVYVITVRDLAREEVEMLKRKYGVLHVAVVKVKDLNKFIEQLRIAQRAGLRAVSDMWRTPVSFVEKAGLSPREVENILNSGGYIVVSD